ncbi:MAG TPA: hypothetical protein VF933_04375 [Streptosporangiaceae bacterium]
MNEEWNCDKGRWAFRYTRQGDRLDHPRIRHERIGEQAPVSWPEALGVAARGLTQAKGRAAVLTGGRLTIEDAYAYAKFARGALAGEMGVHLGLPDVIAARSELAELGCWTGERRSPRPAFPAHRLPRPRAGEAVLATWRMLLDNGRLQDGEEHLAGSARPPVARLAEATANEIGADAADPIMVSTEQGTITLPLVVTEMPERVVWVPANSLATSVQSKLGIGAGELVRIARADHISGPGR